MSSTADNDKNTTPATTDASNNKNATPTPSDATNNQNATPTPSTSSNNPSPSSNSDDNDLTSEPELIEASEAHEKYCLIVNSDTMPLPEELEQNGKPSTKVGVPQKISRSMEETRKDFRRKFGWRGSGERSPPTKKEMDGADDGEGEGGVKKGGEKQKKD